MNIRLPLKKKWFEMTKAGIKTEDYREITPYWLKRLMFYSTDGYTLTNDEWEEACSDILSASQYSSDFTEHLEYHLDNWYLKFKSFSINTMTLGYPSKDDLDKILKLEHKGIEIREGNPEWGAEPRKFYFVIKHGKRI